MGIILLFAENTGDILVDDVEFFISPDGDDFIGYCLRGLWD